MCCPAAYPIVHPTSENEVTMHRLGRRLRSHANAAFLVPFIGGTITTFFLGTVIGIITYDEDWVTATSAFAATVITVLGALFVARYQVAEQRQPHVEQALAYIETAERYLQSYTTEGGLRRVFISQHGSEINWLLHSTRGAINAIVSIRERPAGHIPGVWYYTEVLIPLLHQAVDNLEAASETADLAERLHLKQTAQNCVENGIFILGELTARIR